MPSSFSPSQATEGYDVGIDVGTAVGVRVGAGVGACDGGVVGAELGGVVGVAVGRMDGGVVGTELGGVVGVALGRLDGWCVGAGDGGSVGVAVGRMDGGDVGTAVGIDEIVGDAVGFLIRFPSSMQKGNFQSCRLGRNPMDTSTSGVATSKARPPDWPPSEAQLNSAVTQPIVLLTQTNSKSAAGDRPPGPTGSQI